MIDKPGITRTEKHVGFTAILLLTISVLLSVSVFAQKKPSPPQPISQSDNGKLAYAPDEAGNRVPDFSFSGYMAGESAIPDAPVRVIVPVSGSAGPDARMRIQAALDYVAGLQPDARGIRGAVLLEKGRYLVNGTLKINASGVVLRGSGAQTVLFGAGKDRETLIRVLGKNDKTIASTVTITDSYVPVNSFKIHVPDGSRFKTGERVALRRPSTQEWIKALGTETFGGGISALGWKPGEQEVVWDRTVVAVNGNELTLDAPVTTALDATYGAALVAKYTWPGRISQVGIERMDLESAFDAAKPKDEDHRWMAITIENAEDAWVQQVNFKHFAGSAVSVLETARRITVQDCKSLAPVSEIGGQRRYTFFTAGGQTLFQRLYSEYGYHDFGTGYCAPGPNAFVQCESKYSYSYSGAIDSWASGLLFDVVNIDGNALRYTNLGQDAQGAGWNAANSVFWQCTAARIDNYKPPTAQNWAFGSWAQFSGDGYWNSSNEAIQPRSLYYAQLADRLGKTVLERAHLISIDGVATSSPTVEQAALATSQAAKTRVQLAGLIDQAPVFDLVKPAEKGTKTIDQIGIPKAVPVASAEAMTIKNGWLVRGNAVVTGSRNDVPWWNGSVQGRGLALAKPAITRFVPGRTGTGLTDDLNELTDTMVQKGQVAIEQNYALWYDRRRDDHERIRRMDGEVWVPFYEVPFARSGKELAWDGLSKYDLTTYNYWYWNRLKQFADLADKKGLVLIHQNYFQHNIIEAGAHYADFPWRTANNINNTGFPEPPPYAGDKRIFLAEQFYDISNPVRRKLNRDYIRKCLDNFKDNNGVIQLTGAEFTGPLHFVQFWLDTIAEWEKETGKKVIIGLSTTKDVQDAILADPKRAGIVDLIDIRYWHYQADGTAYAPAGGQSLAPRQQARQFKPKKTSFAQVYRAVMEYRQKYPAKAVIYSGDSFDSMPWAILMAGGSLSNIPAVKDPGFLKSVSEMKPVHSAENLTMADGQKSLLVYAERAEATVTLPGPGNYKINFIDPKTGGIVKTETADSGTKSIKNPTSGAILIWATRN